VALARARLPVGEDRAVRAAGRDGVDDGRRDGVEDVRLAGLGPEGVVVGELARALLPELEAHDGLAFARLDDGHGRPPAAAARLLGEFVGDLVLEGRTDAHAHAHVVWRHRLRRP